MTINERIKKVRLNSGLNQISFAGKIGIGSSAMSKLEKGDNSPSEQTIRAICSQFGINRQWLETGVGDMLDPQLDDDLDAIMAIMHGQSEIKKQLVRNIAAMPDDLLEIVLNYLRATKKEQ